MIPWRLKFSGIRDYRNEVIDLSGVRDHVLITGPNGAGKSTITYCLGAVLSSTKVDLLGLRSRNLAANETWKATIALLFKVLEPMEHYVEFRLLLQQDANEPLIRQYEIATGQAMDEWDDVVQFRSGDKVNDFAKYRQQLIETYHIHPDFYYSIWHQQEVNQFAEMAPEERYRIFSEMFHITPYQQEWERQEELLRQAIERVRHADASVELHQLQVTSAKREFARYEDRLHRLTEGSLQWAEAIYHLRQRYEATEREQEAKREQLEQQLQSLQQTFATANAKREQFNEQITTYDSELQQLDEQLRVASTELAAVREETKVDTARLNEIYEKIDGVEVAQRYIHQSREQLVDEEVKLEQEAAGVKRELELVTANLIELEEQLLDQRTQLQIVRQAMSDDSRHLTEATQLIHEHKSSYALAQGIDALTDVQRQDEQRLSDVRDEREQHMAELCWLKEQGALSQRQYESLRHCEAEAIEAYPFHMLLQLTDDATIDDERRLNAIKYSIFYYGESFIPCNDLLHVNLMSIVPQRSVTVIPQLKLAIRDDLRDHLVPYAMKALWWIWQNIEVGHFDLKRGIINVGAGMLGSQENDVPMLRQSFVEEHYASLQEKIALLDGRIHVLQGQIGARNDQIRHLQQTMKLVKEAEALLTLDQEREQRTRRYETLNRQIHDLTKRRDTVALRQTELYEQRTVNEWTLQTVRAQLQVYTQYEQYEQQLADVQRLQEAKVALMDRKKALTKQLRQLTDVYEEKEIARRQLLAQFRAAHDEAEQASHQLVVYENDLAETVALLEQVKQKLVVLNQDRDWLVNREWMDETMEWEATALTEAELQFNREKARIMVEYAYAEDVNEAARENFETAKNELERLQNEYVVAKAQMAEIEVRVEAAKTEALTTIELHVAAIHRNFASYMAHFDFDGEISFQMYEDSRRRKTYQLNIKARKQGHTGPLEEVGGRARGGRIGSGVSGGEESLSSLLFALALLEHVPNAPQFLILDEFDSALDEQRKVKVFDLFAETLQRKLIILTPKAQERTYVQRFDKALVIVHDRQALQTRILAVKKQPLTSS